jgi:hypothetical protein
LSKSSIGQHRGGDKGIVLIGNALKSDTTLKSLDVYRIKTVGNNCIRALLDSIRENPALVCVDSPRGINDAQRRQELWHYLELNKEARRVLNAPLNLWPLVLTRADRCRRQMSDPPSMLYCFVKEKCDLFNVSVHDTDDSLESEEKAETPGRKRDRRDYESASPMKRTKSVDNDGREE